MRFALIFIILIYTSTLLAQPYFDKIYYTKDDQIREFKQDNFYYKLNSNIHYKGTKERLEFINCDTVFKNCKLKRLTHFNTLGEILYDSLVINNVFENYEIISDLCIVDSMYIYKKIRNGTIFQIDTLIFNSNKLLVEHRSPSAMISYIYNYEGQLINQITNTKFQDIDKKIFYFQDSIIVTEVEDSKFKNVITKWFYYFNTSSKILKDSFISIEKYYKPSNINLTYKTDTSYYTRIYIYTKNDLTEAKIGKTKLVISYKNKRRDRVEIYNLNNKLLETIIYYYDGQNIIKNYFKNDYTKKYKTEKISFYDNGSVKRTISNANGLEEKVIVLDSKKRIIEHSEKLNCVKNRYIDY